MWSSSDSCSSMSATFWDSIAVHPAGAFSLARDDGRRRRGRCRRPERRRRRADQALQIAAQSAAGSPEVASTIESTPCDDAVDRGRVLRRAARQRPGRRPWPQRRRAPRRRSRAGGAERGPRTAVRELRDRVEQARLPGAEDLGRLVVGDGREPREQFGRVRCGHGVLPSESCSRVGASSAASKRRRARCKRKRATGRETPSATAAPRGSGPPRRGARGSRDPARSAPQTRGRRDCRTGSDRRGDLGRIERRPSAAPRERRAAARRGAGSQERGARRRTATAAHRLPRGRNRAAARAWRTSRRSPRPRPRDCASAGARTRRSGRRARRTGTRSVRVSSRRHTYSMSGKGPGVSAEVGSDP